MTGTKDVVTPTVHKRESKPNVQLRSHFLNTFRSPFLNTFRSSSDDVDKLQMKILKTIIFGLRAYLFRMDLNVDPTDEAQTMFDDFIYEGIKHCNK